MANPAAANSFYFFLFVLVRKIIIILEKNRFFCKNKDKIPIQQKYTYPAATMETLDIK